jgi:hypothetical protein
MAPAIIRFWRGSVTSGQRLSAGEPVGAMAGVVDKNASATLHGICAGAAAWSIGDDGTGNSPENNKVRE